MAPHLKNLALVVNHTKPRAQQVATALERHARALGAQVRVIQEYPLPVQALAGMDACCVIGGDGTLMGTVEAAIANNVPVFGVNRGKLGFLVTLSEFEAMNLLPRLLNGHYLISERNVLRATAPDGTSALALNDVVLKNSDNFRVISLSVRANNELVSLFAGDGVLFSTATGSTAYNLSSGGPIMHPDVKAVAMTPICPHTLSNRTVIFNADTVFEVSAHHGQPIVSVDGYLKFGGAQPCPLKVSMNPQPLRLIQPEGISYFEVLRRKLHWNIEPDYNPA